MDSKGAKLLVQKLQKFPPHLLKPVKEELCGKWAQVFSPIDDYCFYTENIKEKQTSFIQNTIDNVIRGNEVKIHHNCLQKSKHI